MNTKSPEDLFYENVECPFQLLAMTSFELGLLYEDIWGNDQ